jgi:hypothetical protein
LKLIIGKNKIEEYINTGRGDNDSMDNCTVSFMWRNQDGTVHPAIIVFEVRDFKNIVRP